MLDPDTKMSSEISLGPASDRASFISRTLSVESKNDNTPSKILFDQKKAEKAREVERGGSGRASAGSVVMGDGAPIPGGVAVGTACLSSGHGPLGVPHAIGAGAHAATRPSISESP